MTLIAGLKPDARVMLFGDILISEVLRAGTPLSQFKPTFLPSVGLTVPPDPGTSSQIGTVRQKVVVISNNLVVAWSGDYPPAARVITAMRDHFPPGSYPVTPHDVHSFIATCDYHDLYKSDLALVGFCSDTKTIESFGHRASTINLPSFGTALAAGSGKDFLLEECKLLAEQGNIFPPVNTEHQDSAAIAKAMFLTGWLTGHEIYNQEDVHKHHFGGFYETAVMMGAAGFNKIDDMLFTFTLCKPYKENKHKADFYPLLFVKLNYKGDLLLTRRINIVYQEAAMPRKQDNVIIVTPIYREVSSKEAANLKANDINARHFCHVLFIERENEPYPFFIVCEVSPDTPSIKVTEKEDGKQTFAWHNRVLSTWIGELNERGILIPKDWEGS